MSDPARRERERRLGDDPASLAQALAARRRAGLPVADLLEQRRLPARELRTRPDGILHAEVAPGRVVEVEAVRVPECVRWWALFSGGLSPGLAEWIVEERAPGLCLERAPHVVADLLRLGDAPGLTWLSLERCPRVEAAAVDALAQLDTLSLAACDLGGVDLRPVAALPGLLTLHLGWSATLADADLAVLADAPALERLSLSGSTDVSDAALRCLPRSLTRLDLRRCRRVKGVGLAELAGLRELSLELCDGVNDAGLTAIGGLRSLRALDLSGARRFKAERLAALGDLALEDLRLARTSVDDRALAHVGRLRSLRRLDLEETAVTDAGLERLRDLAALEWLSLKSTSVTTAGVKRLVDALPRLRRLDVAFAKVERALAVELVASGRLEQVAAVGEPEPPRIVHALDGANEPVARVGWVADGYRRGV